MRNTMSSPFSLGALVLTLSLSFSLPGAEAGDTQDIRALLTSIQKAAAEDESKAFEAAVGNAVLRSVPEERLQTRLAELRRGFLGVKIGAIQAGSRTATAELSRKGRVKTRSQVTLMKDGGSWRLSSPYVYLIEGPDLDKRRGRRPMRMKLDLRTKGGPYGSTAYSFRYATGDAKAAKNRIDIWVCHNNDIHVSRDGRIVALGKQKLSAVNEIPAEVKWDSTAPIRVGHTYVVLCRDRRDRDFYVKLRVKSMARSAVNMEWTLLTGGFGAPADIHSPTRVAGRSGADGTNSICSKQG